MLHPQAQALMKLMEERGVPPTHTLTPADARAFYRQRRTFTQPEPPEVASVRDLEARGPAGPIPVRSYRPAGSSPDAALPVLVYYHGGGWVIGALDEFDTLGRQLAEKSSSTVVLVDYRLAPEHRYPAAAEDAYTALEWVADLVRPRGQVVDGGLDALAEQHLEVLPGDDLGRRRAGGRTSRGGQAARRRRVAPRSATGTRPQATAWSPQARPG